MTQVTRRKQAFSLDAGSKGRSGEVLYVACGEVFQDDRLRRLFGGHRLRVISRANGLLDALEHLERNLVDLILLGHELGEEDSSLFVAAARRRGFSGPIFRVASSQPDWETGPGSGAHDGSITLTARERDVLRRVSEGWSNREISRALGCSESAIKGVLQQLFNKLGVRKRAQVVRLALEKRLPYLPEGSKIVLNETRIHIGDFVIDLPRRQVLVRGVEIRLTPQEFELLAILGKHPDELLRHERLLGMLWNDPRRPRDSLRVLVSAVRAKLEKTANESYIVTQHSLGYRFRPSPRR